MAVEVRLPKLSDEMEEGTVSRWLKQVGEAVTQGEPLVEVETEKVIVEVEANADGVLLRIVAQEQEVVPVEGVLCLIGEAGEKVAERPAAAPPARARPAASQGGGGPPSNVVPLMQPQAGDDAMNESPPSPDVAITPLARRVATELGVDLSSVRGTGIGGKIIMSDLQPFLSGDVQEKAAVGRPQRSPEPAPAAAPREEPVREPGAQSRDEPLSRLRSTIARRMGESKREIPHFYMTAEIDVTDCLAFRKRLSGKPGDPRITVNDLMIKAAAGALRKVPEVNAEFRDGAIRRYDAVHIGFAVAAEEGLVTPVVRDCHIKAIGAIARETSELIERARKRTLAAADLQGGTFTISNLGMYDVSEFAAIINPPQVGILGIAKPAERAVAKNGWVVVRTMMNATLSADHRAIDGVTAAAFLDAFRQELGDPERLLL
jgi:pyruvate dehydrogenase E2 component (dihydrolipoamide acetyltransferase)